MKTGENGELWADGDKGGWNINAKWIDIYFRMAVEADRTRENYVQGKMFKKESSQKQWEEHKKSRSKQHSKTHTDTHTKKILYISKTSKENTHERK